jgi:hypothetical protein
VPKQAAENKLISTKTNDVKPVGEIIDSTLAALKEGIEKSSRER